VPDEARGLAAHARVELRRDEREEEAEGERSPLQAPSGGLGRAQEFLPAERERLALQQRRDERDEEREEQRDSGRADRERVAVGGKLALRPRERRPDRARAARGAAVAQLAFKLLAAAWAHVQGFTPLKEVIRGLLAVSC
jgi:hypothetical protein